jgi:Zn finger protein HypA/HybF involved in hydrogenase expression
VKKESATARNAALDLTEVAPTVRCRQCNHEFEGHELPAVCPKCYSVRVEALNSTDMILEGFET